MTTIILHGYLKELHPDPIVVEANSAAEAIHSLSLIPALKQGGKRHVVRAEGFDSADALFDKRNVKTIHLHPVMAGAGGGGLGQIVLGITIVAVSFLIPPAGISLASIGVAGTIGQASVFLMGAMMTLGGVLQMLSPQPSLSGNSDERSRYLGNGRNTVAIGTRIPMIYGRRRAYGQYLSFDIDSGEFDKSPEEWYSSTFTDFGDTNHSSAPPAEPIDDPQSQYRQPTSIFTGFSYPDGMTAENIVFLNFDAVALTAGNWDMSFKTGQILRVNIQSNGMISQATLRGGLPARNPVVGTPISFSQNYG